MARKSKDKAVEGEEGEKPAKGKSNLVPAVIVAVGLIVGGKFMGGGSTTVVQASAGGATTTTTAAEGEIVKLDSITLNLSDGHFLKIGLALQLIKGGPTAEVFKAESPKALDLAISLLGAKTMEELSKPHERELAKQQLSAEVKDAYAGKVLGVLFTEFVMQ